MARLAATVDLPTPPLPLAMAITWFTPAIRSGPFGCARAFSSGGGGAALCAVITAETLVTPGAAFSFASASARTGSSCLARAGSTSSTKRTAPSSTLKARTMPAEKMSCPLAGSATPRSTVSTSSRVGLMRPGP